MSRIDKLFQSELQILNIGTETFKHDFAAQGVQTVQLDWKPPAGGNPALISALDRLTDCPEIEAANAGS
jgi:hypothetical protein